MATLADYRAQLAKRGGFVAFGTTGVQSSPPWGAYTGIATGAELARRLVSSDLAYLDNPGTAGDLPGTKWENGWIWVPGRMEQRKVAKNGFVSTAVATDVASAGGTTKVGHLTAVRAWGDTLAAGLAYEIHTRWPVLDTESMLGLHTWINKALSVMRWPDRIAVTSTGAYRYDLSAYPWLTKPQQIVQVLGELPNNGSEPIRHPGRAFIRNDGNTTHLVLDSAVEDAVTFYVDVYRPPKSWIKVKRTALATATVAVNAVTAITVVTGGGGYTSAPTVTITGAGTATATATINASGVVTSIAVTSPGSGAFTTATVTIAAPTGIWGESTVGLVNEEDEAQPAIDDVVAVAYYHMALMLHERGPTKESEQRVGLAAEAAKSAMMLTQPIAPRSNRRTYGRIGDSLEYLRNRGSGRRSWS